MKSIYQTTHQQYRPVVAPAQQTNVIYKVASQSMTPDYISPASPLKTSSISVATQQQNSYPVMDTTVASSVKGEPELNIGNVNRDLFTVYFKYILHNMEDKNRKLDQMS